MKKYVVSLCRQLLVISIILIPVESFAEECPEDIKAVTVNPGSAVKLQLLLPGESTDPGSVSGKTGTPDDQEAGTQFSLTVNCVDPYWNKNPNDNPQVKITSTDQYAILPANNSLSIVNLASMNLAPLGTLILNVPGLTPSRLITFNTVPSLKPSMPLFVDPKVMLALSVLSPSLNILTFVP